MLLAGGIAIAFFWSSFPRAIQVSLAFPSGATKARVRYLQEGEVVRISEFAWAGGAPRSVRHEVQLVPGPFRVEIAWTQGTGPSESFTADVVADPNRVCRVAVPETREP